VGTRRPSARSAPPRGPAARAPAPAESLFAALEAYSGGANERRPPSAAPTGIRLGFQPAPRPSRSTGSKRRARGPRRPRALAGVDPGCLADARGRTELSRSRSGSPPAGRADLACEAPRESTLRSWNITESRSTRRARTSSGARTTRTSRARWSTSSTTPERATRSRASAAAGSRTSGTRRSTPPQDRRPMIAVGADAQLAWRPVGVHRRGPQPHLCPRERRCGGRPHDRAPNRRARSRRPPAIRWRVLEVRRSGIERRRALRGVAVAALVAAAWRSWRSFAVEVPPYFKARRVVEELRLAAWLPPKSDDLGPLSRVNEQDLPLRGVRRQLSGFYDASRAFSSARRRGPTIRSRTSWRTSSSSAGRSGADPGSATAGSPRADRLPRAPRLAGSISPVRGHAISRSRWSRAAPWTSAQAWTSNTEAFVAISTRVVPVHVFHHGRRAE